MWSVDLTSWLAFPFVCASVWLFFFLFFFLTLSKSQFPSLIFEIMTQGWIINVCQWPRRAEEERAEVLLSERRGDRLKWRGEKETETRRIHLDSQLQDARYHTRRDECIVKLHKTAAAYTRNTPPHTLFAGDWSVCHVWGVLWIFSVVPRSITMSLWTHTVWEITLVWLTASRTVCSSGYLLDRLCSPFFLSVSLSPSLRLWIFFLCEKYCFYPPDIALLLKFRFHPVPCQRDGGEDVCFFFFLLSGSEGTSL